MTDCEIQKKVKQFRKQFHIDIPAYDTLCAAVEEQGYTVVEFNNISNNENVKALVDALKLTQNIVYSKGFTYANSSYRIVFVNESLSDEEKLIVLSHEQGHIYLGHLACASIIGKDVKEEYEANEFAHYLLNPGRSVKTVQNIKKHKKAAVGIMASLAVIICAVCVVGVVYAKNVYYGEYYVTSSGAKYHTKDCSFVSGKKNIHRLTKEEYESGEYEPCQICIG